MNILVDTQILVWSFDVYSPLSKKHKALLEDVSNKIFVSQVSLMELAIKKSLNKLPEFVPDISVVRDQLLNNGFDLLKLKDEHIFAYQHLPFYKEHKDPFDRFLIATAQQENFTLVTTDAKFQMYTSLVEII